MFPHLSQLKHSILHGRLILPFMVATTLVNIPMVVLVAKQRSDLSLAIGTAFLIAVIIGGLLWLRRILSN
jgi:hypothetical protein